MFSFILRINAKSEVYVRGGGGKSPVFFTFILSTYARGLRSGGGGEFKCNLCLSVNPLLFCFVCIFNCDRRISIKFVKPLIRLTYLMSNLKEKRLSWLKEFNLNTVYSIDFQ